MWFLRKLRAIDSSFSVHWDDKISRWIISEGVPWAVRVCVAPLLYTTHRRKQRIVFAAELGSHVLEWVKRSLMRRFETVDQMVKEMEIDKSEDRGSANLLTALTG